MDEGDFSLTDRDGLYVVIAREGSEDLEDCHLAREHEPIPSTHVLVFGPEDKPTCEVWKAYNCEMKSSQSAM